MTDEQERGLAEQAAIADATDPKPKPPASEQPASPEKMEAAAPAEPSLEERAHALVAAYEHGMATNGPRTLAELKEIKALLGVD